MPELAPLTERTFRVGDRVRYLRPRYADDTGDPGLYYPYKMVYGKVAEVIRDDIYRVEEHSHDRWSSLVHIDDLMPADDDDEA